jgi:7-carboxy-7-deazaguanine synthase
MPETLSINEIYHAIQGEGTRAGRPCVIIRLSGCNLHCRWCDTRYADKPGERMTVADIVGRACRIGAPLAMVTGGEPMLQASTPALLTALCDAGLEVLLQTNGSIDLSAVGPRVVRCMDVKCPGSGEGGSLHAPNLDILRPGDEVKMVLSGEADYRWACGVLRQHDLPRRCTVTLAPAFGELSPADLARWILRDGLNVRLGVQLHKIIVPGVERGV